VTKGIARHPVIDEPDVLARREVCTPVLVMGTPAVPSAVFDEAAVA
jgi:hypothetical protein